METCEGKAGFFYVDLENLDDRRVEHVFVSGDKGFDYAVEMLSRMGNEASRRESLLGCAPCAAHE